VSLNRQAVFDSFCGINLGEAALMTEGSKKNGEIEKF